MIVGSAICIVAAVVDLATRVSLSLIGTVIGATILAFAVAVHLYRRHNKVKTLVAANHKLDSENKRMVAIETTLTARNQSLAIDNRDLKSEKKAYANEARELASKNQALTNEVAKLVTANQLLTNGRQDSKVVSSVMAQNRRLVAENSTLSAKNNQLMADNERLRAENDDLETTSQELTTKNLLLTGSADPSETADLTNGNGDVDHYEQALGVLANIGSRFIIHKEAVITYKMGVTPLQDEVNEEYSTLAADETLPVLWCEARMDAIGAGVPQPRSFRDLRDVKGYESYGGDSWKLRLLPAGSSPDGGHRALAMFDRGIHTDAPRGWGWGYRWPVFEPLRRHQKDTFGFRVSAKVTYERLVIHIVLPGCAIKPRVHPMSPAAERYDEPQLQMKAEDEAWDFMAVLVNPAAEYYLWLVTVEGFTRECDGPSQ